MIYFRRCKFFHFFALICFCGWLNFNNFVWAYFCGYQICNLYTHYFNRVERTLYYKITEDIPNQPICFLIQIVKKQNSFLKNDPVLVTTLTKISVGLILASRKKRQISADLPKNQKTRENWSTGKLISLIKEKWTSYWILKWQGN